MNILLVYPEYPDTFWSFKHALKFISKKADFIEQSGIMQRNRKYYWNLMFWSLFKKPGAFPLAVTYSIFGYHFRQVFKGIY